jgi:hypothetical protein
MKNFNGHEAHLVRKLSMYLDNELDQQEILQLKQNPDFHSLLEREQNFRHFIKTKVPRRKVSSDLIQSIKEKIRMSPQV